MSETEDKVMADRIRVLLTEEEVDRRINEVAAKISEEYEGRQIHLICILKGGVFFTCELVAGKDVLIVEDIIDSGRTLAYLIEVLKQRGPKSIRLCTLLDKPERRVKKQVKVDYTCFTIPDEFVVGYGLDYDQKYRNLPYIGVVELDNK